MESTKLQGVSHLHAGPAEGALALASQRRGWSLGTPCRQQSTQDTPLSAVGCSVAGDVFRVSNRQPDGQDSRTLPPGQVPCSLQDPILKRIGCFVPVSVGLDPLKSEPALLSWEVQGLQILLPPSHPQQGS